MPRIHPAWRVAGATFLVLLVAAAIRATASVLIVPFEREFGWSRATISAAISVNLLLYGLMGPFCAAIAGRIGVRRTMAIAMSILAAALLLATAIAAIPSRSSQVLASSFVLIRTKASLWYHAARFDRWRDVSFPYRGIVLIDAILPCDIWVKKTASEP